VAPLQEAICKHSRDWVVKLGEYLAASTKELNSDFDRLVSDFETDLHILPRSVDELKKVFQTVQMIQSSTIDMEGRYRDLIKRYMVLEHYSIEVNNCANTLIKLYFKLYFKNADIVC